MGKTTTKDAIYEVVRVYDSSAIKSEKSYNTDIGVPLAILQLKTSVSILVWAYRITVLFFQRILGLESRFSSIVLEMGIDKLGDLDFLTSRVKPKIAVLTKIGPEHLEFLGSMKNVISEETKLISCLDKHDTAILNADDTLIVQMAKKTKAHVVWYGQAKNSDVRADSIEVRRDGIHFIIRYAGQVVPVSVPSFGRHHIYPVLAAFSVGASLGMKINDIVKGLKAFHLPEGRGVVLQGSHDTIIIDDTYNASPASVVASISALQDVKILSPYGRSIVVIGDMLELGRYSTQMHQEVGEEIVKRADVVIAVGNESKHIYEITKKKLKSNAFWFEDSTQAAQVIGSIIQKNDIILVKGSRGMKMERVVESLSVSSN